MRRPHAASLLGLALWCGAAAAVPGQDEPDVVHITALRDPAMRSYRAIAAGMDTFDARHALAPAAPALQFQAYVRAGTGMPAAKLDADDFTLPLAVDGDGRFGVPRSQAAWDAKAALQLDRKRKDVKLYPSVRTPGLPGNQRRLGDLRLECRVMVTIMKEEIPFHATALINGVFLTTDWCGFFKDQQRTWDVPSAVPLRAATLRDGERSLALRAGAHGFKVPLGDTSWPDDAIVELEPAPALAPDDTNRNTAP